jgi:DNA-binding transcriptional MerR regulator
MMKVEMKKSGNGSLRSGQLARLTGVSTDTLRHYERKGLLKSSRSANGYRAYSPQMIDRVLLIRNALAIGFGLDELVQILKIRDAGGAPCKKVRAMVAAKLDELERFLGEMTKMRDEMQNLLGDWDERLESTAQDQPARLLESLSNVDLSGGRAHRRVKSLSPKRDLQKEKK